MARNITQDERQLIKLIEKLPVAEEQRNSWVERIRNGEMSKELAEEVRQALSAPAEDAVDTEQANARRTRSLAELSTLVKRWQLSSQSHNFGRR